MGGNMGNDVTRFRRKTRDLIKNNLGHLLNKGYLTIPKQGKTVRIPVDRIEIPHFNFGSNKEGVAQGDGEPGDPLPGQSDRDKGGDKEHGENKSEPAYFDEYTREGIADLIGEALELPHIRDPKDGRIAEIIYRYDTIRQHGPQSLRTLKRTYLNALKRSIATGTYDSQRPIIIPERPDERFRAPRETVIYKDKAVMMYLLDASGSMEGGLDLAKHCVDWIDLWLERQYSKILKLYFHHDMDAYPVDRDMFFRTSAGGGTNMAVGLELVIKEAEPYITQGYDVHLVQLTDGDKEILPLKGKEGDDHLIGLLRGFILLHFAGMYVAEIPSAYKVEERYSDFLFKRLLASGNYDDKLRVAIVGEPSDLLGGMRTWFGKPT